jgi:hypothetical protein
MKNSVSLAITLLIGCATGAAVSQVAVPSARASAAPDRWEYQCTDSIEKAEGGMESAMDKLGHDGWELVSANHESGSFGSQWTMCFKRGMRS